MSALPCVDGEVVGAIACSIAVFPIEGTVVVPLGSAGFTDAVVIGILIGATTGTTWVKPGIVDRVLIVSALRTVSVPKNRMIAEKKI